MRNKLNQFVSNLNGQFVEVSYRPATYQCFDLVYAWVFCLDVPKATIQHGSAFEIWTKASSLTREHFDLIENKLETIPEAGDLVVWSDKYGKYGHVAIVISATQARMKVFEQNNPLGTNAHIQDRSYTNVSGFLRKKDEISEEDKIGDLTDSLQSCNTDLAKKAKEVAQLTVELETQERDNKDLATQLHEARTERDKKAWEVDQLTAKNKTLAEEVAKLKDKVVGLKEDYKVLKTELVQSQARILTNMTKWEAIVLALKKFINKK